MNIFKQTACIKTISPKWFLIWIQDNPSTAITYDGYNKKDALSKFKEKHRFTNVINSTFNIYFNSL